MKHFKGALLVMMDGNEPHFLKKEYLIKALFDSQT
jgi:hypothetical protein